ncbi:MAG: bifunctional acetate--CoA ligase family protein/GNAT family N-acetyltransferase [Terriglobales bacterium]
MSSTEVGLAGQPVKQENQPPPRSYGLDAIFAPTSVAVIGATGRPGAVGRIVLENLLHGGFRGKAYAVNAKHPEVLGLKAYASVRDIPGPVDLAVIATPAASVPQLIGECVDAGAKSAVVLSAGFRERGAAGVALEQQILEQLQRSSTSMRLIGPNCLGVMNPTIGLNATWARNAPQKGNVAFLSQSGALLTAILDWSQREHVGFSAIVSTGSMLDVGWGDLIYYFGDDPYTKSILLYMESVGDARSFLSAAREVALTKPIIAIKAGRSEAASRAAASHTGALTGSDDVLEAAFRRSGVLRVHNIADLFHMAEVLGKQPRPKGPRLTIVTNAGGPGVIATDSLVANGGELAELSPESLQKLDEFLPAHWSHNNPIDVLGDADCENYARAFEIAAQDPNSDGLLVILSPQGLADPALVAERLKPYAKSGKPVLASWMGGNAVAAGEAVLNAGGIPTFPYPDTAARAFSYMWRYTYVLRGLYETPALAELKDAGASRHQAEEFIQNARQQGRVILNELESKRLLSLYGIPTVETRAAASEDDAATMAAELGFPVVLKILSTTITHKTDVGGVKLNLRDEAAVRAAFRVIRSSVAEKAPQEQFSGVTVQPMVKFNGYDLIVGSSIDPQFGPVILFGSGGLLVDVYGDHALALPPLNTTLAQRMMEQTRIFAALKGVRGRKPVNMAALENLLVRFSQFVLEQRWVAEIEINPLLASPDSLVALDARIVLHGPSVTLDQLPRPAIRPYPVQYVSTWTMKNGDLVHIRPIRAEDEPQMIKFHETLSDRSVYLRYFSSLSLSRRVAHERLLRICFGDYDREMVLVAEHDDPTTGERRIIGVGRMNKFHSRNEAEVAALVTDQYQRMGLGHELLRCVVQIARDEKVAVVSAEMLPDNIAMQAVFRRLGFLIRADEDLTSLRATMDL